MVLPQDDEFRNLRVDLEKMTALAKLSGGEVFKWTDAPSIENQLRSKLRYRTLGFDVAVVWKSPWLFLIFILLLAGEWTIRARIGWP